LTASAAVRRPTTGSSDQAPTSALPKQAEQQRAGEVGAEHVLAALALGRGGAELVGEALLGDPEVGHHDRARGAGHHPEVSWLGIALSAG
jgi:hypothetical protein